MAKLKRNKHLNKAQLFIRKKNPWSEPNKKIRELNKQSKNKNLSHGERSSAKAKSLAVKRTRDDESIAMVQQRQKSQMKSRAQRRNEDWKKMKSGKMSKEAFIKKYPESQTAKAAKKRG